jgi:uroporphyrinogen decarboxylase
MEVLGKIHPAHRRYDYFAQCSDAEKELTLKDWASCYVDIAKKYNHSAILIEPVQDTIFDFEIIVELLRTIREMSGMEYYICMHGDPTCWMPNGSDMTDFSVQLYEDPQSILDEEEKKYQRLIKFAEKIKKVDNGGLLDGFAMCSDYCFNANPFFSPEIFGDLIAPYLAKICESYRAMGYYTIKHTDGNIMPILDQLVQCAPDALQSLDPQGGVDLKFVKEKYGNRIALMGNVNCGLLQTGTDEEVAADVRRALRDGMPGYGYIFSTSNCV